MSFDFDPVKVAPPRRGVDLLPIGVLAILLALVAAVVKPWQAGGPAAVEPSGVVAAVASPSSRGSSVASATPVTALGGQIADVRVARTPTWRDLEPAIRSHDSWGVRVILLARRGVKPDPRVRYMEGWTSTTPRPHGLETTTIDRDDRSIVALGITYPTGSAPQQVRISRLHTDDQIESIDARPLDRGHADGAFLFLRFGVAGTGFQTWDAGRYRIDMLGSDGPRWIRVEIPEKVGTASAPDARPAVEALVVGQGASDPRAVRAGLFASVNGGDPHIDFDESPPLQVPAAWFDAAPGPTVSSVRMVARSYLPRPVWLGVMLAQTASVRWATIRSLAPEDAIETPVGGGVPRFHGRTPFVVFGSPHGGAWPAGVYAISVAWVDRTGPRIGTWQVELGRVPIQPAFLARP